MEIFLKSTGSEVVFRLENNFRTCLKHALHLKPFFKKKK